MPLSPITDAQLDSQTMSHLARRWNGAVALSFRQQPRGGRSSVCLCALQACAPPTRHRHERKHKRRVFAAGEASALATRLANTTGCVTESKGEKQQLVHRQRLKRASV